MNIGGTGGKVKGVLIAHPPPEKKAVSSERKLPTKAEIEKRWAAAHYSDSIDDIADFVLSEIELHAKTKGEKPVVADGPGP